MAGGALSVYDFSARRLEGQDLPLRTFAGKVLLIVNTASRCGFTPQYAALQRLYEEYGPRGFEVLGFPCDQFGHQEPGTEQEIRAFCEQNYRVRFPLFAKIDVNGAQTHPLYRFLKRKRPGIFGVFNGGRIGWNFAKFLVDREGQVVGRFAPMTPPGQLAKKIEALLK